MSRIFTHYVNADNGDFRADQIVEYIADFFTGKLTANSILYIVDPFMRPYEQLIEPVKSDRIDGSPYSMALLQLLDSCRGLRFRVLTSKNLATLKAELPKTNNDEYHYAQTLLDNEEGRIEFLSLPSNSGGRSPRDLHDRWMILKSDGSFSGLHLGPSLHDYQHKDFTITVFDMESAKAAGERCEGIWQLSAGWMQ